ncbi:MAG: family 78 glycoside hydrolase catalytic domain [Kiritimatiellae bacterium]|nr:family 78 glycoside hydrolase catalytic domain [Kiritimatiellia bacterium]
MKKIAILAVVAALQGFGECRSGVDAEARTTGLTVCRLVSPANVVRPVFAWKMESARSGAAQSAYRIKVYEGGCPKSRTLLWDSKVVLSGISTGIRYTGPELRPCMHHSWEVAVRNERGEWLEPARGMFDTGFASSEWKGSQWIRATGAREATKAEKEGTQTSAPGTSCFVKEVKNAKAVREAFWTVTGNGVFEAYINGVPVSRRCPGTCCRKGGCRTMRDMLKPGFTHAFKTRHSFTYDVTHLMDTAEGGSNVFSAMVSAGWWRDKIVNYAGKFSSFRAVLILRYADGSERRVPTDTSWLAAVAGPVKRAAIFDGEFYDARAKTCWMKGGPCDGFAPAVADTEFKGAIQPMEGATIRHREDLALKPVEAYVWKGVSGETKEKFGTVRKIRVCKPGETLTLAPGETLVVDFAQNAAAVPEFTATAETGTVLTILPGEMLNDGDGLKSRGNDGPEGSVYRQNLRKLWHDGAIVEYTFAGEGDETYRPEFTFFGYRYASLSATGKVTIKSLRSIPVTSISKCIELGRLSTGEKDVNKLISNILWGQYSNYLSVPTDCPQRNERLGWAADTQVFSAAAARNADVYSFLSKWMHDVRDTQHDDGSFTGVAPQAQYGSEAGERIGWADAGVIVPHTMWRMFGDTSIIDDNWDAMERYLALISKTKFDSPVANEYQWADWLSFEDYESAGGGRDKSRITAFTRGPDGKRKPRPETIVYWHFLGGCYWMWDSMMMRDMAEATGRSEAVAKYSKMVDDARAYMRGKFLDKSDGLILKPFRANQTPSLFLLKLGLLEGERAVAATKAALLKNIADHDGCLTTGFIGASILMDTLTYDVGAPEAAYSLLLQHKNPSWLYSVDQGATTIWERWNSYVKATGFGPVGMNSFNHYAYGAVLSWMYGTMAGIREDLKAPGFKHIILAPIPDRRIGHVDASYDSAYGRITSCWRYGRDKWTWTFSIPANTTATVKVPGKPAKEYVSGTYTIVQ